MLTRRENLLIRPWQERRYIHHKEKVKYALPAIDNTPPPKRPHVSCKLKKIQKEAERCSQIVNDNFTLLQHLSNIMRTTRVDHFWEEPPPNFLQRVGIYKIPSRFQKKMKFEISEEEKPTTRKERCYGCSPDRFQKVEIIPEERIPFAPPKKRVTRKVETPPDWGTQYKFRCAEDRPEFRGKVWKKSERRGSVRQKDGEKRRNRRRQKQELLEQSQCIYLSKGGLTLAVKFPSRSEVLMSNQRGTRVLQRELCECKSFPRKLSHLRKASETLILKSSDKSTLDTSENDIEDKTMISVTKGFSDVKVTKEEEKRKEKSIISNASHLFSNKELDNIEHENWKLKTEEERKQEEIELEREELPIEEVEEEELEQDEIDEEEHEADDEEEVEQEVDVEEEVEQEANDEEEVEQEADVEEEVGQEADVEEEVEQEQIVEEEVALEVTDEETQSDLIDSDQMTTEGNENEVMIKFNTSEGKDSEEENNITIEEKENSSNIEQKKFDDQTGKDSFLKGKECTVKELIETVEGNEELIDFDESSKRDCLVRFSNSNQLVKEEENSFTDEKSDKDISTYDQDKGHSEIKEVKAEIGDLDVYDRAKESLSLEDEYTEEPIAIEEIGMKDTFSETENELLLRGITFDTSQELITEELIEHNEDEAGKVEKSEKESTSKESMDEKIKKVLEDAENVILELNKDDWLENLKSGNMEVMNNDNKLTDKDV